MRNKINREFIKDILSFMGIIVIIIIFIMFILYLNNLKENFKITEEVCHNITITNENILIGEDFKKGMWVLTYYPINNYDLSNLSDMGGLGFGLEIPNNKVEGNLSFNYPGDLIFINCPKNLNHDNCYKLKTKVCEQKEVDEIEYQVNQVNRTVLDKCSYLFGSSSDNITLGIIKDKKGDESLVNVSLKNNNFFEDITVHGVYVVVEFTENTTIDSVQIENKTIKNSCRNSDIFYKVKSIISKEQLSKEWLNENSECLEKYNKKENTLCLVEFSENGCENFEYDKCLKYKIGNYTVEVLK